MDGWYVIQVQSGKEVAMAAEIAQRLGSDVVSECFAPRWQAQVKVRGEWKRVQRNLIPGYVIAVSGRPDELEQGLRQMRGLTRVLKSGEVASPLQPDEVAWFEKFTQGAGDRVVPMSSAVKVGDEVIITDGPLREHRTLITRIDRHRSTAYVEISILGRRKEVPVGLKIVAKPGE